MRECQLVVPTMLLLLLSLSLVAVDAFMTPTTPRRATTVTISSFQRIKSKPAPASPASYVNADVSTFLFRDLLKKFRSGGKNDNDNDNNNSSSGGDGGDGDVENDVVVVVAEKNNDGNEKEKEMKITENVVVAEIKEEEKEEETIEPAEEKEIVVLETTATSEEKGTKTRNDETEKEDDDDTGLLPFFAQVIMGSSDKLKEEEEEESKQTKEEEVAPTPAPPPPPTPAPALSPREKALAEAQALRAQAEKARLEADKMDAMLTLDKIVKLETELNTAQKKNDNEEETRIQKEIQQLQAKLRGGEEEASETNDEQLSSLETTKTTTAATTTEKQDEKKTATKSSSSFPPLSYQEIQSRAEKFQKSPKFMKQLIAKTADFDFTDVDSINTTALIVKLYEDEQKAALLMKEKEGGSTTSKTLEVDEKGMPKFTVKQIEDKKKEVERLPQFIKNLYGEDKNNDTAIAIALLEENWKEQQQGGGGWFGPSPSKATKDDDDDKKNGETSGFGGGLFSELRRRREDMSELDAMVETLYPKTTRKENEGPTEAQVTKLLESVLTKKTVPFMPSGKPEAVPGGFLIRGTATLNTEDGKNGDDLIKAIDTTLETNAPSLQESLSIFYIADPYPQEEELGPGDWPPVLFITGPDVWRGPQQIIGTIITSAGLATLWYTAIYPFLLNPTFMKRADEELALGDAGMTPDLGWLNDLASPLFLCLLGIQLSHEVAHRVVAAAYEMEVTLPTFIPSLVSGIASSITTLKTPPKNKQALFDFAIAGPLTGMILSLIALYFGCVLTASTDATSYANLPSLPIQFLRESALGGGIIDIVLGNGVLDIVVPPTTTTTTAAAASAPGGMSGVFDNNLPLHPLAIAGYISLQLNALSLLPFGRTDGGRISLALFGRNGAPPVGLLTALGLFIRGAYGSDLILFYTTFLLFFQGEPEIPLRNEVDEIEFSRVLLATVSGVLVLLTLFPM